MTRMKNDDVGSLPFARFAFLITLCAGTVAAQSPLVTRAALPAPGCASSLSTSVVVADFDSSTGPDLLYGVLSPATGFGMTVDPATSPPGGACVFTPAPGTFAFPLQPVLALANLNGDAYPDMLYALYVSPAQQVFEAFGNGAGGFVFGTGALNPSFQLSQSAVGDLNGDGRDDVVSYTPTGLQATLNLASGWVVSWSAPIPFPSGPISSGDFDGDGDLDIIWAQPIPNTNLRYIRIALGSGQGTFEVQAAPLVPNTNFMGGDDMADLDGDGKEDLITRKVPSVVVGSTDPVIVWGVLNDAPSVTFLGTVYGGLSRIWPVDFDRDGILDLVVEGNLISIGDVLFYRGLGNRQFASAIILSTEAIPVASQARLFVMDVDADQDPDVLRLTLGGTPSLVVLRNETVHAPGCAGTGGLVPTCSVGLATPGNAAFAIGLSDALPASIAVLGVSLASVAVSGCGLAIDLGQLVLPFDSVGIVDTSISGTAVMPLPLPPASALSGSAFYAQWGVLDPQGSLPAAGLTFALSDARTIYVW